jgi:hypothetical protein
MFNVLKTEDPCNSALNDQQKGIEPGTIGKEISNTDDWDVKLDCKDVKLVVLS